jgi:hypothetical protein
VTWDKLPNLLSLSFPIRKMGLIKVAQTRGVGSYLRSSINGNNIRDSRC